MAPLTAADIAWHMRNCAAALQHEWITPNAILYAWESDLLTVTRDHFVCEVEIKISRDDLLNDLKKPKHSQGMLMNGAFFEKPPGIGLTTGERKEMQRRKSGETLCRRPNYFCFAMPCEVYRKLPYGSLPPYAGVFTVDGEGRVFEERRPIQLHSEKIPLDDLLGLSRRLHYRYWDEVRRGRHEPVFQESTAAEEERVNAEQQVSAVTASAGHAGDQRRNRGDRDGYGRFWMLGPQDLFAADRGGRCRTELGKLPKAGQVMIWSAALRHELFWRKRAYYLLGRTGTA